MFWTKRVELDKVTHCEFVPEEAWGMIPVCRDKKQR